MVLPLVSAPSSTVTYASHNITFVGVTGPVNGLCTWTYYVCSGGGRVVHAISHWDLESCVGTTNEWPIEWGTDPNQGGSIEYGTDQHTGITGIKFDVGMDDYECATFWFKVKECTVGQKEVGIKSGQNIYTGSYLPGPSHETTAPEFGSLAIPATIASLAVAGALIAGRKK